MGLSDENLIGSPSEWLGDRGVEVSSVREDDGPSWVVHRNVEGEETGEGTTFRPYSVSLSEVLWARGLSKVYSISEA